MPVLFPVLIRKESHHENERLSLQLTHKNTVQHFSILASSSSCDILKIKHHLSLKTNDKLTSQLDPSGLSYVRTSSLRALRASSFAINSTMMILPVL